jgi:hypothetical protein
LEYSGRGKRKGRAGRPSKWIRILRSEGESRVGEQDDEAIKADCNTHVEGRGRGEQEMRPSNWIRILRSEGKSRGKEHEMSYQSGLEYSRRGKRKGRVGNEAIKVEYSGQKGQSRRARDELSKRIGILR